MGIDTHGLNYLTYANQLQPFGHVATIGRQQIHLSVNQIKRILDLDELNFNLNFCEEMLLSFYKAISVTSFDHNKYEGASVIHDFNFSLPNNIKSKFDLIIDYGTTEHIYNVPQALKNYSHMVKEGGVILHILPANNFNGHGFYQFSPELFYSLYSRENGYDETVVFLADLTNNETWYKPPPPSNNKRVLFTANSEIYVLVRTKLVRNKFKHDQIQQSDYVETWATGSVKQSKMKNEINWVYKLKNNLKKIPIFYSIYRIIRNIIIYKKTKITRFSKISVMDVCK